MKDINWFYGHIKELMHAEGEMDGFDMAFYDACIDILKHCGDGGISENYINGARYILSILTDEAIGGIYNVY